jgi:hypothetical protein
MSKLYEYVRVKLRGLRGARKEARLGGLYGLN